MTQGHTTHQQGAQGTGNVQLASHTLSVIPLLQEGPGAAGNLRGGPGLLRSPKKPAGASSQWEACWGPRSSGLTARVRGHVYNWAAPLDVPGTGASRIPGLSEVTSQDRQGCRGDWENSIVLGPRDRQAGQSFETGFVILGGA